jgi:hypothetical protein
MTMTVLSGAILIKASGIGSSLAGASAAKTDMGIYVAITSAPPNAAEAFSTAIYREQVPPDQYAVTFFRLIGDWQTAGVRIDAFGASRNLEPYVATLRKAA